MYAIFADLLQGSKNHFVAGLVLGSGARFCKLTMLHPMAG